MSFRIGQRVRIVRSASGGWPLGEITEIASELKPVEWSCGDSGFGHDLTLKDPDFPDDEFNAPPEWLEPYDDGRSPIAWTAELLKLCRVGAQRKEGV